MLYVHYARKDEISFHTVSTNVLKHLSSGEHALDNLTVLDYSPWRVCQSVFFLYALYQVYFAAKIIWLARLRCERDIFFTETTAFYARLVARYFRGANIFCIFHDDFYLLWNTSLKRWKYNDKVQLLRRATCLFCVSSTSQRALLKHGVEATCTAVVGNGVDGDVFYPAPQREATETVDYILAVGSEIPRKNTAGIVRAFAQLKQHAPYAHYKLIKVGHALAEDRAKTLALVEALKLQQQQDVIFHSRIDLDELRDYYSQAKAVLFPSLAEGFGLPIIEAQLCGTPVITTNYPPMSELVPYPELLVDPQDAQDICSKLIQLLGDDAYRAQKVAQGLDYAQGYSWEAVVAKIAARLSAHRSGG